MTYAMMTSSVNGVSDVVVRRDGEKKIVIRTDNTLTDDQMRDLYWVALLMSKTGKKLKELMGK